MARTKVKLTSEEIQDMILSGLKKAGRNYGGNFEFIVGTKSEGYGMQESQVPCFNGCSFDVLQDIFGEEDA